MKKAIIGFEVTEEKKQEIVNASKNYQIDNIKMPLKISQFIRIAVEKLLKEIKAQEGGEKLRKENLNMRSLLTDKQKHLLWKDELGDDFIILKYAEVYRYSKETLMVCCWSRKKALWLINKGVVLTKDRTDDLLYYLEIKIKDLPLLIELGAFKRRPNIHGKWIAKKGELLGHKIILFRPVIIKQLKKSITNR